MLHRGSVQEGLGEGVIGSRGLAVEEHWVSPPPRWEGSGGLQRGWEAAADHQFFLQDVGIQFAEAWGWNPGNDLQISMDPQLPPRAGLAELGLSAYEVTRYINDAHPIVIEPAQVAALPDWDSGEEARAFAAELRLPFDKTYLDLTDGRGQASLLSVDSPDIAFEDGSRAYPDTVSLEGALCYEFEGNGGSGVAIHPLLGSPQERYLFEVSDRFMFPRVILTDTERMPDPMPGTILLNLDDGVTHVPWPDHDMCPSHLHAQWSLVAVSRALACFYLLDSPSVALGKPAMSRQARRQAERRKSPIASVVEISGPQQRADEESVHTRSSGDSIDYSHRFEVQGHWRHYTKGPIFEKGSKPCSRCGQCRRVWVPPFVKGPLDKPLMPKVRLYRSIIGSAGAADASHYQS